jgi:rod shape-determining protein MreC
VPRPRVARPRRSRRTLTTLVVLVLLSVTIITLDETGKAEVLISGVKTAASDVYSPLRSGVNGILDPIGQFFAGAVNYGSLQQENQKLQAEIQALEHQGAASAAARQQLSSLERLQRVEKLPALAGITSRLAEVTAQTISDFAATVTIDKGRDTSVTVGDPVLGPGGLVGQVVIAHRTTSTVRLVTDAQSNVGVTYGHQEDATVAGQGPRRDLAVDYVSSATPISKTETLVTSGLQGAAYPAGIPVAKVTYVKTVAGATDRQVRAAPIVDVNGLTYVDVLVWSGSA